MVSRTELQELLMDLQHDLGKYVAMPLTFLPAGAGPRDVKQALHKALMETRPGKGRPEGARALWERFRQEAGEDVLVVPGYRAMEQTVERALCWESVAASPDAAVDRAAVEADLGAVTPAIRTVIQALERVG